MIRKRLKCALGVAIPLAILVIGIGYNSYVKIHTFTLSGDEIVKTEQIQPITGSVKVTGNTDTDVVFTDIESGETYTIKLKQGKWYRVECAGKLTLRPVNVRIE